MTLQSTGFKFFAKIMWESCVFCCSSCISFSPTNHLDSLENENKIKYFDVRERLLTFLIL